MESDRRSSPETNEGGEVITLYQLRYWCGRKQDKREHTNTNITLPHRRVSEATQHYAETRIPQPGSPRSHRASHQASSFSLCASQVRLLSRSLCRSHVLTTFLDPVLRGHDEAGLLAFEALQGYRGLPEARGQSEAHGDSNLHLTIVGVPWQWLMVWQWYTVVPSGLSKVLLFVKAAPVWKKRSLQNLIFGAVKHWSWTPKSSPVALKNRQSNNPQLWSTCVMRRPFCVKVWWEDVQCTEPPWTHLNIFKPVLEQCMCRWTVRNPFLSL